jgi:hypothetical protein
LGEVASHSTTMKFVDRFLGEVLTTGYIDSLEPAATTPAPRRYLRDTNLRKPSV